MTDERLIRKFLNDKTHITIDDCDRILASCGYYLKKSSGSHRGYHHKGFQPITIVQSKKTKYVKIPYVNRIIKNLRLEE
ncbi:MAG TPA: hypothetical protein DCX22_00095 [Dehalococcoidia bacterium]|nr:hypothetical protein [Dehalococcoidia bacterium]